MAKAMKAQGDYTVLMSDKDRNSYYTILGKVKGTAVNCITEYSIQGGPETPFEILSILIPKQRLKYVAPDLVDGIEIGRNEIVIDAVGYGRYTVVKCKYSGRKYRITAYCNAERLKGSTLYADGQYTPEGWIVAILSDSTYNVTLEGIVLDHDNMYTKNDIVRFSRGTSVWYVLQVCAILMGCKIWFAENKAYVVDCTRVSSRFTDPVASLDLYPDDEGSEAYSRTVGDPTLGNEGTDTIVNSVIVRCMDTGDGGIETSQATSKATVITASDDASVRKYGESKVGPISVMELREGEMELEEEKPEGGTEGEGGTEEGDTGGTEGGDTGEDSEKPKKYTLSQGTTFATNYMRYLVEPQQNITFEMKEMEKNGDTYGWVPYFSAPAACTDISDDVDEIYIDNESSLTNSPKIQKLLLSQYERHYPEGTTAYTFGLQQNIDLSSSTSQIMNALYNN
jgi:hypothetical protein|nr:MAG TPA: hypothetical protein [Caudoviricetes sp.]